MCLNGKFMLMIRFILPLIFTSFVCPRAFGQFQTELIKRVPTGSSNELLIASNNQLYFICKDDESENAVFVADANSDEALLYYKHQTINSNTDVKIIIADANYLYFSARKQNVFDNRPYLHRVNHSTGVVELLTDEVLLDDMYSYQCAKIGEKFIFRGRTIETQPQNYYYSFDLQSGTLTPLIHVNNTYDYISKVFHHTDGLLYITLRLANGFDYHDFVTDGTAEGTNRFLDPSTSTGVSSVSFIYSIDNLLYFDYKWNGQYLGKYRSKGFGYPIEPFSIILPVSNEFHPYFPVKDKILMHYAMDGDMHLRYGEINMNTGEFSHCHTYDEYFIENDYVEVKPHPFVNRSVLIRKYNFSKYQGFIEDCSIGQAYELPFKEGETFEMIQFYSAMESGGVLYIAGIFKLANESQNQHALIRIKPTDLSVKKMDENLIQLFPNPANDKLIILTNENTEISIYNTTGKLIYDSFITLGNNEIDLNDFQAGIYLVKLSNGRLGKFLKL